MNLLEYLFYNNINKADFARELGITRMHLSGSLHGHRLMSMKLCKKVEEATGGKIKAKDLRQFCIDAQYNRMKNDRKKHKDKSSKDNRHS